MAGTITFTEITHGTVKKIKAAWTTGTGADINKADGTTINSYSGRLLGAITVPSGAPDAPTNLYNIAVNDNDSVDVALGALAGRSATVTEFVAEASMAGVAQSKLTIAVTAAGDTKKGTLYLHIR